MSHIHIVSHQHPHFRYAANDVLRATGSSISDMLEANFSATELRGCGVTAGALHALGCSAQELLNAGFSVRELKIGGCGADELKDAG